MKCEKCGKNEAAIYYKENINGQTHEAHLCADCAQEMHLGGALHETFAGFSGMQGLFGEPFPSLLGGSFGTLWNSMAGAPAGARRLGAEQTCPTCGMTESTLRRTGRAGCPDCYHTFEELLNPYIRKVHGADSHLGARPQAEAEKPQAEAAKPAEDRTQALREKQRLAIRQENYEEAARLRDEIKRLEGEDK